MSAIKLHPKQQLFVEYFGPAQELFFGGAAGGGKSYILRVISIILAVEVPGIQIYLFRRLSKDLLLSHMKGPGSYPILLRKYIDNDIVQINNNKGTITFDNGSIINLSHIQYESNLDNYLSQEIHVALFDEATTFTEKMIRFIRSRVRVGALEIPEKWKGRLPAIGYASNPRGIAHHYFRRNFVKARPPYTLFRAPKNDGGMTRMFIPSKLEDNPTLWKNDPNYADRLAGLGDDNIVKAYLEGDWDSVEGAAFEVWDPQVHIKPRLVRIGSHPLMRAYDYGSSAPYSTLWFIKIESTEEIRFQGQQPISLPPGSIVVARELYGDDGEERGLKEDVTVTAMKIRSKELEYFPNHFVRAGPADNSIFHSEQGPSIASKMIPYGIDFIASDKSPGSRITGLATLRSMMQAACSFPYERPVLLICDDCERLMNHIPSLQLGETLRTEEDVATDGQPDHDYDVLRYIALMVKHKVVVTRAIGA